MKAGRQAGSSVVKPKQSTCALFSPSLLHVPTEFLFSFFLASSAFRTVPFPALKPGPRSLNYSWMTLDPRTLATLYRNHLCAPSGPCTHAFRPPVKEKERKEFVRSHSAQQGEIVNAPGEEKKEKRHLRRIAFFSRERQKCTHFICLILVRMCF